MTKRTTETADFYKKFYKAWENALGEAFDMWAKSPFLSKNKTGSEPADGTKFDPNTYYKRFYEVWEKYFSETLEAWEKTPLFSQAVGKAVERSSELKKTVDDIMERTLRNMNLPSKNDIDRALAAINKIEEKVNDLIDKVDEIAASMEKK